ncbi:MAG: hypothetical protein U0522_02300 [Candidatus Paceibacterota bacterium]
MKKIIYNYRKKATVLIRAHLDLLKCVLYVIILDRNKYEVASRVTSYYPDCSLRQSLHTVQAR